MIWTQTTVADDGTHHLLAGQPLYAARFQHVQKFHAPGLAPVVDQTSAFHVDVVGQPAYSARFRQAWGFYDGRAAVEGEEGWLHVLPDGVPLSDHRYAWCGNFQDGLCTVRGKGGLYWHITRAGQPAYAERYLYAGDFRDGAAVVRCPERGRCTHVDPEGRPLHGQWFLDLDVFHKGYARARDALGWFHIGPDGLPSYTRRFTAVEPFYNGTALCESVEGDRMLVDPSGRTMHRLRAQVTGGEDRSPRKVLLIGNIGSGKTTVRSELTRSLGWTGLGIDECRRAHGDGTPAGELRAWAAFAAVLEQPTSQMLEFSGTGEMVHLVRKALEQSGVPTLVIWLKAPAGTCQDRLAGRAWDIPYLDFGVPMDEVVRHVDGRLSLECAGREHWKGLPIRSVDATVPAGQVLDQVSFFIEHWKKEIAP